MTNRPVAGWRVLLSRVMESWPLAGISQIVTEGSQDNILKLCWPGAERNGSESDCDAEVYFQQMQLSNAAQTVEQNGAVLKYPLLVITRTSKCDPKAMQP